ncbi:MAG: hypothetical protein H0X33_06380 [Taibaiella sp.]|nr:hypothetical protein [Taibaiella sp.]
MKAYSFLKTGTFLIAISMLSLTACKRNTDAPVNADDVTSASDHSQLERENNDAENVGDVAYTSGGANLRTTPGDLGSCVTVTNNTAVTPHVLTIDFGTTNCTGADGRNRRGKIIISYTGGYKDSGSTHTITFDNYFIDDNQLSGSKTVTNMGRNASGQYYYNISVNDSLNLGTGNGIISWTATRTRTWIAGYSTDTRTDDVYDISGTSTVTRSNGKVFTVTITTPLQVAIGCRWVESGVVSISRSTGGTMTLDYGSGNCDAEAQLTVGSHTYNITLRH